MKFKYYVVGIMDCSAHAKNKLHLIEVEALDEDDALRKAFLETFFGKENLSFNEFKNKIGKRFAINTIEI